MSSVRRVPFYLDEGKEEITNFFDKVRWKYQHMYNCFVVNTYDPSKFWLRFAEVEELQKKLQDFYSENWKSFTLTLPEISIGMNCVIFKDNQYYRAKIVKTDIQNHDWFLVFLYDHATTYRMKISDILKLHKQFTVFPAFAVRGMLADISPIDNENYPPEALTKFNELTKNKKLAIKISYINVKRKLLEVHLMDPATESNGEIPTINYLLVEAKLAKEFWKEPEMPKNHEDYERLRKFMYLFPVHEMIENGTAPSSWELTEKLKECVYWDVLFPELYKYVK